MILCNREFVFQCPAHGEEVEVFCWRAFQEENKHLWYTAIIEYKELSSEENELIIKHMQQRKEKRF